MKKITIIFILVSLFCNSSILAQNDTIPEKQKKKRDLPSIVTDRPDATESSSTVPMGTLQIESGFIFESERDHDTTYNNWGIGTTLLRYGVWDNFELRLGSYYQISEAKYGLPSVDSIANDDGLGPIVAGFKVYVINEKGIRPEISILADITLRHVGSPDLTPTFSYPTAKIAVSHTLAEWASLGYNVGFAYDGEKADGFFVYSVVMGFSLAEKWGMFVEGFGHFDHGNYPNHILDGGFTYLLRNNLQLDISGGYGLTSVVNAYYISTGFSWRIPR